MALRLTETWGLSHSGRLRMHKPYVRPTPLLVSVEDRIRARSRHDARERAVLHMLRRMRRRYVA